MDAILPGRQNFFTGWGRPRTFAERKESMERNYREHTKRLLCVTRDEQLSRHLLSHVHSIFGDNLGVACFTRYVDESPLFQEYCALHPNVIVGMSDESAEYAAAHASGIPVIRGSFRVHEPKNIDKLFLIPPGQEVLVINKTKRYSEETISSLISMGIRHIHYVPYYEGCPEDPSQFDTAIAPGVFYYCPHHFPNQIDIGFRSLTIETCREIAEACDLSHEYLDRYINVQERVLIRTFKGLSEKHLKVQGLKNALQAMIDNLGEAIIALDQESRIAALNAPAAELFHLDKEIALGTVFDWLVKHADLEKDLLTMPEDWKTLVTIGDRQCYLSLVSTGSEDQATRIIRFRDVNQVQANDSNMRRLLYQKFKGYVAKYRFEDLCVADTAMKAVADTAKSLAVTDHTILITGESGTGKELLASSIHNASPRANCPFVAANFAAIPENLIESELFGYEEGAFTGAKKHGKAGLFELAHTGSIFLDEIGDASLSVQARLLRVLEEKEIMRVGGTKVTPIDVRVIAATNKNLRELIREGKFRADLYFRINVFQLMLPPLRERTESIFPLISIFSKGALDRESFTESAAHTIETYDWPGNLRELRNMVNYVSIMRGKKKKITEDQFPIDITTAADQGYRAYSPSMEQVLSRFSRPLILMLLELLAQNKDGEIRHSRSDILKYLQGHGLRCSTTMLHSILAELEAQGMILAGKTRQGTRLSAAGQRYLNALHAEDQDTL